MATNGGGKTMQRTQSAPLLRDPMPRCFPLAPLEFPRDYSPSAPFALAFGAVKVEQAEKNDGVVAGEGYSPRKYSEPTCSTGAEGSDAVRTEAAVVQHQQMPPRQQLATTPSCATHLALLSLEAGVPPPTGKVDRPARHADDMNHSGLHPSDALRARGRAVRVYVPPLPGVAGQTAAPKHATDRGVAACTDSLGLAPPSRQQERPVPPPLVAALPPSPLYCIRDEIAGSSAPAIAAGAAPAPAYTDTPTTIAAAPGAPHEVLQAGHGSEGTTVSSSQPPSMKPSHQAIPRKCDLMPPPLARMPVAAAAVAATMGWGYGYSHVPANHAGTGGAVGLRSNAASDASRASSEDEVLTLDIPTLAMPLAGDSAGQAPETPEDHRATNAQPSTSSLSGRMAFATTGNSSSGGGEGSEGSRPLLAPLRTAVDSPRMPVRHHLPPAAAPPACSPILAPPSPQSQPPAPARARSVEADAEEGYSPQFELAAPLGPSGAGGTAGFTVPMPALGGFAGNAPEEWSGAGMSGWDSEDHRSDAGHATRTSPPRHAAPYPHMAFPTARLPTGGVGLMRIAVPRAAVAVQAGSAGDSDGIAVGDGSESDGGAMDRGVGRPCDVRVCHAGESANDRRNDGSCGRGVCRQVDFAPGETPSSMRVRPFDPAAAAVAAAAASLFGASERPTVAQAPHTTPLRPRFASTSENGGGDGCTLTAVFSAVCCQT